MKSIKKKIDRRRRVRRGIRKKIAGTGERPRMSVFRSNKHVYAQLIDDTRGMTVASASSLEDATGTPSEVCEKVGKRLAERATEAGFDVVVFDRNGYAYHGRIKALADGAREGGLKF